MVNVQRIAYGMLKVSEAEFPHLTLTRLQRAKEWFQLEDEMRMKQTRLICYYQGNHKASSPEDLWKTGTEWAKYQKDLIEGKIPIATFKKLSPEDVKKWTTTFN